MAEKRGYPTGGDVVIPAGHPLHPGGDGRPLIGMVMCVSAADQRWMDDVRDRSYRLAVERRHIRA